MFSLYTAPVVEERTVSLIIEAPGPKKYAHWENLPYSFSHSSLYEGTLAITHTVFNGNIPKERNIACLDADKLQLPLTLRNTQNGDRFAPFGMRGTKLVSDYLTDRKKSLMEKKRQLVVTDATGKIIWLVNERPSSRCCVDKKTEKVLILEWKL